MSAAERLAVPNRLDEEKQEKLNRDLRVNINILGILQNNNLEEIRKLLEAGADANGIPRGYEVPVGGCEANALAITQVHTRQGG